LSGIGAAAAAGAGVVAHEERTASSARQAQRTASVFTKTPCWEKGAPI
jgi:hypothetical protein